MPRTGIAELPLHHGECPRWLFDRMVKLSREICRIIILEYGTAELLRRLADPYFFQSLGCVVGFDWHSSGLTTTLTGALKEALSIEEHGIAVCGGKGKVSRLVPEQIEQHCEMLSISTRKAQRLIRASVMAAKVDNSVLQDGYDLYHHCFIFDEKGRWAVIQQGMNPCSGYARRYHWLGERVRSFVNEPHSAVCCEKSETFVLNMVARESEEARKLSVELVNEGRIEKYIRKLSAKQRTLDEILSPEKTKFLRMPVRFPWRVIEEVEQRMPENYEELIAVPGVGKATVRALALIANLVYGAEVSWRDPAKYSLAHGGKDRVPYPVDKPNYDRSIQILKQAVEEAEMNNREKLRALKKLSELMQ